MDFKTLVEQITTLFSNLNKKQKTIIGASTLAVISFLVFLVLYTNSKNPNDGYAVLFNKLSASDSALVITQLESENTPYKIVDETTIKVPKDVVYKERITIAALGIPKNSKVGFELFDTQNFGETDFAQNIKYMRALEGELSRTIQDLTPIEDATVRVALPKDSVFVQKETLPTASVVIKTKESMHLSTKQAIGIKNLISASVTKLLPENVKIIDQNGDPIDESTGDGYSNENINAQLSYKKKFERELEKKIEKILSPIIGGKDRLAAKVTAEFDFKQKSIVDEYYDPESVVRSEKSTEEKKEGGSSKKDAGGVPGAISNISPTKPLDKSDKNSKEKYEKSTTTTNYEISKKITNTKGEFAKLIRITSAVVVDGKYEKGGKKSELKYTPLDKTEVAAIDSIVKRTIGYNQKRGDEVTVTNLQFKSSNKSEDTNSIEKTANMINPFLPILKYLFAAILLFIFYKKIISPFSERMIEDFNVTDDENEDIDENIDELDDDNEALDKYNNAKRKIEKELGIHDDMDEDMMKHSIILDKMRGEINEHPDELAKLIETIMKNDRGL